MTWVICLCACEECARVRLAAAAVSRTPFLSLRQTHTGWLRSRLQELPLPWLADLGGRAAAPGVHLCEQGVALGLPSGSDSTVCLGWADVLLFDNLCTHISCMLGNGWQGCLSTGPWHEHDHKLNATDHTDLAECLLLHTSQGQARPFIKSLVHARSCSHPLSQCFACHRWKPVPLLAAAGSWLSEPKQDWNPGLQPPKNNQPPSQLTGTSCSGPLE